MPPTGALPKKASVVCRSTPTASFCPYSVFKLQITILNVQTEEQGYPMVRWRHAATAARAFQPHFTLAQLLCVGWCAVSELQRLSLLICLKSLYTINQKVSYITQLLGSKKMKWLRSDEFGEPSMLFTPSASRFKFARDPHSLFIFN